jgi:hypothetical protein
MLLASVFCSIAIGASSAWAQDDQPEEEETLSSEEQAAGAPDGGAEGDDAAGVVAVPPEAKRMPEDEAAPPESPPEPDANDSDIEYELIGFLRLEGAIVQDDADVGFVGRNDGFRLQNARVGIDGTWRDRLRIRVSADGAVDERQEPNDVEGTLRLALRDAFADVLFSPKAVLRVARFKTIFDIEEGTSPREQAFIDRALSSRGVFATEGFQTRGLGVRRSLGVALRSEQLIVAPAVEVGYELAAQNGNDDLASANDNDALALSTAVWGRFNNRSLVFVAGRFNRRTEGDLPFRRTEDDFAAVAGTRVFMDPVRFTVQGLFQRTTFNTTGGPDENAFGAHAEAVLRIPNAEWFEVGYRYSVLDRSDLISADRVQEHTGGINVMVEDYHLRLQLNYTHAVEQAGRDLDNDRIEGVVEVQL